MKTVTPSGYKHFYVRSFEPEPERLKAASTVLAGSEMALHRPVAVALGPLSIAAARHQDQFAHWLQIRSGPLPRFGGAEFRFDLPAGKSFEPEPLIGQLVEAAARFVGSPDAVTATVENASSIVRRAIGQSDASAPPALTAVGVRPLPDTPDRLDTVVELRTLGHGLRPVVERTHGATPAALAAKLDAIVERHSRRARLRASLKADGAIGWSDETTRRILAAAGKHPAFAIERLEESGTMGFWMVGDPGSVHGKVYWREGVLKVDYGQYDVNFDRDILNVFRLLSAKTLAARIGRPFGKLVRNDFVPAEAIVLEARRTHADTYVTLAIPKTLLPARPAPRNRSR